MTFPFPIVQGGHSVSGVVEAPIALVVIDEGYVSGTTYTPGSTFMDALQDDDFVICVYQSDNDDAPATMTGWTTAFQSGQSEHGSYYYKQISGTPNCDVGTFDVSTNTLIFAAFRNVDSTTPLDVTPTDTETSNTGNPPNAVAITSVTNNALLVTCAAIDDVDARPWTAPSGFTLTAENGYSGGGVIMAHRILATAGTINPATWNGTGDDQDVHSCLTFALRPKWPLAT